MPRKKKGGGGRSTRFSKPSWWKSRCSSTGSARFPLQLAKQSLPHQRKLIVRESVGGGSSVREKTRPWWDFIITTTTVFLRKTKDCKIKNRQLSIVYSIKIGKKKKAGLSVFLFFGVGWGKRKEFCVAWCCCVAKEKGYYTDGPRFRIAFVHFRRHFISWGPSMLNTYNAPDASSFIHSLFLSSFIFPKLHAFFFPTMVEEDF